MDLFEPKGSAGVCLCAALFAAAVALAGCGGGGGGSAEDGTRSDSPLPLNTSNSIQVARATLASTESLLATGLFAAEEVQLAARRGSLQFEANCGAQGQARYTLTDVDGNGLPSAGDTLTVLYMACGARRMRNVLQGTMTIRLQAAPDAQQGAVSGSVNFGASGVGTPPGSAGDHSTWLGTLQFSRTVDDRQDRLSVSAAASDGLSQQMVTSQLSSRLGSTRSHPRVALTRVLQRDTAESATSGSFQLRLASQALTGSLEVNLPQALRAAFGSYPASGRIEAAGAANARLSVAARDAVDGDSGLMSLDTNGDGLADSSLQLRWDGLSEGLLWSPSNYAGSSVLRAPAMASFQLVGQPELSTQVDVATPLRLQFNRPLDPGTVLHARLLDFGEPLAAEHGVDGRTGSDPPLVLAADVELAGALVLVRPRQPLRHGRRYELQWSNTTDFDHTTPVSVRDQAGNLALGLERRAGQFYSDQTLWSAIGGAGRRSLVLPGRSVSLNAVVPLATSQPLRYRWSQLDGPPLVLGQPTAASTTVQLADGMAPGTARATLALTVTDAIGRSETATAEVQVANPTGLTQVLYFSNPANGQTGGGVTRLHTAQNGEFSGYAFDSPRYMTVGHNGTSQYTKLYLAAAGYEIPGVGAYTGALALIAQDRSAPLLDFSSIDFSCPGIATGNNARGSFQVLDVLVTGNQVQRLAVDFELLCAGGPEPLRGSLRFNSTLPIRP